MQYRVRIFKSFGGRSGARNQWSNSYMFSSDLGVGTEEMTAAINRLVTFEKAFHLQLVHFMRCTVSLIDDSILPQFAQRLRTVDLQGTGVQPLPNGSEEEPLEMCLRLKFTADSGRAGGGFYRGVLSEGIVSAAGSGVAGLTANAGIIGALPQAMVDSVLAVDSPVRLALPKHALVNQVAPDRLVTNITVGGVTFHQRTTRRRSKAVGTEGGAIGLLEDLGKLVVTLAPFILSRGRALPAASKLPMLQLMGTQIQTLETMRDTLQLPESTV